MRGTAANEQVSTIINVCLPPRWRLPVLFYLNRLFGRLEAELEFVPVLTTSKDVAIDVGASSGYYTYAMARSFSRVEAFEPISANTKNLAAYASPKIHVHHVALSSGDGTQKFYLPIRDGLASYGEASCQEPPGEHEVFEVPFRRLDDFAFKNVSLIKIDAEGHELEVLTGARGTIESCRPVILMEICAHNRESAAEFFESIGYRPYVTTANGVVPLEGGMQSPQAARVNFIYKPA